MRFTSVVHILAGSVALLVGYVALWSAKGATLHRRAGLLFVYAMLVMSIGGMSMAIVRGVAPAINIPAGLLTTYLVVTALTTVRPRTPSLRWLDLGILPLAAGVALFSMSSGVQAFAAGGTRNDMPAFPFFMFGTIALAGTLGDLRLMHTGPLRGSRRLARHLWRMCMALFIASLSFFIGQARVIPEPIRILPLLALPVLAVLVTMCVWLWRMRRRTSVRASAVGAYIEG